MQRIVTLLFLLASVNILCGQDINFSQFYELPLLRNPALAGTYAGDFKVTSAFRTQWGSVSTPYKTVAAGIEFKLGLNEADDYFSLGLQVTNDAAGDSKLSKTQVFPMLAFHKSLQGAKDSYLSIGFLGGPVQQRFDPTDLRFDDQFVNGSYSPTNPTQQTFSNTNVTYWDLIAGLTFSSVLGPDTRYYIGAAYFHLTEPKVAFSKDNDIRFNRKMMFNAGMSIPTSEGKRLILYADYFIQGGNSQGQGGFMYKQDLLQIEKEESISLSAGIFYRWKDAIIPVVKFDYYKVGLGLTYDANISKLMPASKSWGAFELTLSYRNFLNNKNSSAKRMRCPVTF